MIWVDTRRMTMAVLFSLSAACTPVYIVHGHVESCATRKPLVDAQVVVRMSESKKVGWGRTKEDGTFVVGVNTLPDDTEPSDVAVKKEGFENAETHVANPTVGQAICLTPTSAAALPPSKP